MNSGRVLAASDGLTSITRDTWSSPATGAIDTRKRLVNFAAGGDLANENLLPTDSRLYLV